MQIHSRYRLEQADQSGGMEGGIRTERGDLNREIEVTEQLKADKPLEWVQRMNNIRNAVEEVIITELIYA